MADSCTPTTFTHNEVAQTVAAAVALLDPRGRRNDLSVVAAVINGLLGDADRLDVAYTGTDASQETLLVDLCAEAWGEVSENTSFVADAFDELNLPAAARAWRREASQEE